MPQPLPAAGLTHKKLRKVLDEKLRTAADFDAFCLDCFPRVHRRFTSAMDRIQRTSLLLELIDNPELVEQRLREYLETAEHRRLSTPNLPALATQKLPQQAMPGIDFQGDITVKVLRDDPKPIVPPALFPAPLSAGTNRPVDQPTPGIRLLWAVWGFGLVLLIAGAVLVTRSGCPYAAPQPSGQQPHAVPVPRPEEPEPQSKGPPAQELDQLEPELLEQAAAEQRATGTLGLYLTLSTLEAFRHVADFFVKKPDLAAAMVLRQLIDRHLQAGLRPTDVDPIWARVQHATDSGPKDSVEQRRIRAAMTDDLISLGKYLRDPDPIVRITATQRFVWWQFSSAMVRQVLLSMSRQRGEEQFLAYGLLRQIGQHVKQPADVYPQIAAASLARRCALIAALAQWPAQDAKPILDRIVEQDPAPSARRQAVDSLLEITRRESAATTAGGKRPAAAAADDPVGAILAKVARDSDKGLQLRGRYGLARRRNPAPPPPPSQLDWTQGGSVEVSFTGESQVRFSLDKKPHQVPITLWLTPGPYKLSYVPKTRPEGEMLMIPRGPTFTVRIPVTREEQRLRLVK